MKTFDIFYADGREFLGIRAYSATDAVQQVTIACLGRLCSDPIVVRRS